MLRAVLSIIHLRLHNHDHSPVPYLLNVINVQRVTCVANDKNANVKQPPVYAVFSSREWSEWEREMYYHSLLRAPLVGSTYSRGIGKGRRR